MTKLFLWLTIFSTMAVAQLPPGPTAVLPHYSIGDKLEYTVTFDADPDFSNVALYFTTTAAPDDQHGLSQNFGINSAERAGPGRFIVRGSVPNNIVSGTYRLSDVQPRFAGGGVKDYDASKFDVAFEVTNRAKFDFPPLKDVSPR